jgi:hypothetical protein
MVGPSAPQGGDTVPNRYLAYRFLCSLDLTLDELYPIWTKPGKATPDPPPYYAVRSQTSHLVSTFGPTVPILASPFVWLYDKFFGIETSHDLLKATRLLSGILCGFATMFVFASCLLFAGRLPSYLATIGFAFASACMSVASRGLWQHTFALFFLCIGIFACLAHANKEAYAILAGLTLSLAFASRPMCALFLVAGFLVILLSSRNSAFYFSITAFFPCALLFAYNTWHFGSPFLFGQTIASYDVAVFKTHSYSLINKEPWLGLLGLLLSPSRGIFIFSPHFLFIMKGFSGLSKEKGLLTFIVASLAYLLVASFWFDWWGGATVSYRQIVEITPILTILVARGLEKTKSRLNRLLFILPLAFGILLASLSATHPKVVLCNEEMQVDKHPERLFDIPSSLVLRILEKRPDDKAIVWDSFIVLLDNCKVEHNPRMPY